MFNIPSGTFSTAYTGHDPQTASKYVPQFMKELANPQQQQSVSQQFAPAYGKVSAAYGKAREGIPQLYKQQLQPATQNVLNQLAGRGMLSSTMGSETMANMARNLQGDAGGLLAQLSGQEAGAISGLAGMEAAQGAAQQQEAHQSRQNMLANLAGDVGRYSYAQDPLQPYQLFSGLLTNLMGY